MAPGARDPGASLHDALLRSLGEGVYGVDRFGLCTFINPAALSMLAFTEEEVLGQDQHRLFHATEPGAMAHNCPVHETLADGMSRHTEEFFTCKDGRTLPVSVNVAPLTSGPDVVGAVVVFRDLSESKAAQQKTNELLAVQKAILDNSLAGIALLQNRKIYWVNRRMEEIFGYTEVELKGQSTESLYSSRQDFEMLGARAYPAILQGQSFMDEQLMRRKDGTTFWCQLSGRLVSTAAPDQGTIWTLQDVSERRLHEETLRESEERYRQAFEINTAVKLIVDQESGAILDANSAACKFYGYSKEELLSHSIADINCLSPAEIRAAMEEAASRKRTYFEFKHRLASGEVRDVEVYSGPMVVGGKQRLHSIVHDITDRKRAEAELYLAAQVLAETTEGVVVTDSEGTIQSVNRAFSEITGFSLDEVRGKKPRILASGRHDRAFYENMWGMLLQQGFWSGEIWNRKKDGTVYPEWLSISKVSTSGLLPKYVGIFSDISGRKAAEERIRRLAHFDALTGLPNRTLLADRAAQALSLCRRKELPLAVLFIDLDHFKRINDTLGHNVGDEVLVALASRIKALLRAEDTISRLGGDECVILLPETDAEGAGHVAGKLVSSFSDPLRVSGFELSVTLSVGIAVFPTDGEDFEALCKHADTAMYRAKQEGRNGFRFYTPEMQKKAHRHWRLETALRDALAREELDVTYQPQISIESGAIIGTEALLRWNHPELGTIAPSEFIPIAEETGLIVPIGEWVLRTAVRQAVQWVKVRPDFIMAVNISAVQMRQPALATRVSQILAEENLPAKNVELELTESTAMRDPARAIQIIEELRVLGVKVAVDDFGTGYSSLSYLKRFSFSRLKIDRSFVQDLTTDPESLAIVRAILGICESLGLHTIAEGVETEAQLRILRELGCSQTQGFLLGRPMQPDALLDWIQTREGRS